MELYLCAFIALVLNPGTAEPQNQPSAEFTVLQKFVGVWDTQTHIRHAGPPPRQFTTSGRATCQQTLEGRYVEFRTQSIPPGQADLQVMTYDVEAGVYRQWLFDSDGYHHEAEGRWDPATSTLRWKGKTAETSFVIVDRWVSPDQLQWTLVRTDAWGQTLQTIEGTLTRVK
jgi:hypothetical protein